jgi:cysteine synthase A
MRIEDDEIVRTGYQLLYREGLFLGGANVAAAVRVARELGPGNTVVTILYDSGHKYLSRFWSRDYLEQKCLAAHADAARRPVTA